MLGTWGETLNLTRELTPVRIGADGSLVDRALYVEDAQGGYWTLTSGAAVRDADGAVVARPTMSQVLAQGGGWRLEPMWSPTSRAAPVQFRDAAPYLVATVNGRAVVLDYGVETSDGSWRLASGAPILDASGVAIAAPSLADVLAQTHPVGQERRTEALGFNPFANIPVAQVGLDIVNGSVVDYTVQVTDDDGAFYVWARNLDRPTICSPTIPSTLPISRGKSARRRKAGNFVEIRRLAWPISSTPISKTNTPTRKLNSRQARSRSCPL